MLQLTATGLVVRRASPMGYCDHYALRRISEDEALAARLVAVLKASGGSLAVSWNFCVIALNERVRARIALANGDLFTAEQWLTRVLEDLARVDSRFEAARTHLDLAPLAHRRADRAATRTHLTAARAAFVNLRVPKYVERAERLAAELLPVPAAGEEGPTLQ